MVSDYERSTIKGLQRFCSPGNPGMPCNFQVKNFASESQQALRKTYHVYLKTTSERHRTDKKAFKTLNTLHYSKNFNDLNYKKLPKKISFYFVVRLPTLILFSNKEEEII